MGRYGLKFLKLLNRIHILMTTQGIRAFCCDSSGPGKFNSLLSLEKQYRDLAFPTDKAITSIASLYLFHDLPLLWVITEIKPWLLV
jgi:hypothetical protein